MATWKEGDRVRVVTREVTEEDRKKNRYFAHMAGLTGTVANVYADGRISVQVDLNSLSDISLEIHRTATDRMRDRFVSGISEEQKRMLTKDELDIQSHYVLLLEPGDLVAQ